MVIERSVIRAEGANSAAILSWISDHDGVEDSTMASTPSHGLHGARANAALQAVPARRFVLPARAFAAVPDGGEPTAAAEERPVVVDMQE